MKGSENSEERIIETLRQLGKRAFTKEIAKKAKMSQQTASKYLMTLEAKGKVKKDDSQPPYMYWELKNGKDWGK
ncbi:MAG: FaeA/PapI family transcriptional regulator [Methanomassiliicoccales archaeon]|jgi:DNA-binding IclR family transcriptional regulator